MKRILVLFMLLLLFICCSAFAEEDYIFIGRQPDGDDSYAGIVWYSVFSENGDALKEAGVFPLPDGSWELRILRSLENDRENQPLIIPSMVDGIPVSRIADKASISDCSHLIIEEGISHIGDMAFHLDKMHAVFLPASLQSMGSANPFQSCSFLQHIDVAPGSPYIFQDHCLIHTGEKRLVAFLSPESLEEYTIPDGVEIIGTRAFFGADIQRVILPESVRIIESDAFSFSELQEICLPDSLRTLGDGVFYGCSHMKSLSIPDQLTQIGDNPFDGIMLSPPQVLLSADHPAFSIVDQMLIDKAGKRVICYLGDESRTSITIPQGIEEIGNYAFCAVGNRLEEIILPDTLRRIGICALQSCSALRSLHFPASLEQLDHCAVDGCTNLESIVFEDTDHLILSDHVFSISKHLKSVRLPEGLEEIGEYMFHACFSLESITVPSTVRKINEHAFSYCIALQEVVLPPHGEIEIDPSAFFNTPYDHQNP